MTYARIVGTGSYLPPQIMTNADLAARIDTSNEWIVDRTGIERRHIAGEDETAASMAENAAREAIAAAKLEPKEIDLVIVATATPDYICPSVACLLQHRLGIQGGGAFDIVAACSGFIYGLSTANLYIKAGMAKNVLLVASEVMSRLLDWDDRRTCVLFGDGAGAVVLQASETPGVRSTHIHADGRYEGLLWVPSALPAQRKVDVEPTLKMQGNEVFKLAVNTLTQCVDEVLAHNHISEDEIDWLIPHQANIRIIQGIAKRLKMTMDKVVLTVAQHGNTSAASIPLALDQAVKDGRVKPGDTILIEAFGAGLTWGSALIDF